MANSQTEIAKATEVSLKSDTKSFVIGASAMGKFTEWEGKEEMFAKMGFTTDLLFKIGIVEVLVALLFIVPRMGFLGAILL